jgi:hypothetical protein
MPYVSWTTANIGVNNVNDNNNDNYSIMNILNGFNATAASPYVFKYVAYTTLTGGVYGGEIELVFSQSSNPLTRYNSVTDSTYISGIGWGVKSFNGLSLSSISSNTIIDGTSGNNNWWGAIGVIVNTWNGQTIPSIDNKSAYRVELYVETTNIPLFITSDGSLLSSIFQPVETSTSGHNLRPTDQYISGHNMIITERSTTTLIQQLTGTGQYLMSHHAGTGGKQYSYYFNSLAYLNESEAGTWNFAMRTTDDNFCSLYVLEGNYAWESHIAYNTDSIVFGVNSSPWNGTAIQNGVSVYTIADFIIWVNTNHSEANITKVLEIPQATTTQVNGSFDFKANKQYTILMYWRHHTTATGGTNVACRFGYWKVGDASVTLPANGIYTSRTGGEELVKGRGAGSAYYKITAGDPLPPWFYRRIPESSGLYYGSTPTNLIGDYILHDGSNATTSTNTGFVVKQPFTDGGTSVDLNNVFTTG